MRALFHVAWAGLLLGVSCAQIPDRPEGAGAPVPMQWQAPAPEPGDPLDFWWLSFGDTNLNELVTQALSYNYDLQAAVARLEAALAEARIAGADLYPALGAGFDATRAQRNFIGLPIPGREDEVLSSRSTTYGLNLNLSWEVDLWGRIRSQRQAAISEVVATEADLAGTRLSLAAQTVKGWLTVVEAHRQVQLAQSTMESYRQTAAQVRRRYERGIRPPLDLRLALSSLAGAEALLEARLVSRERAVRQLEILLGQYPAGLLSVSEDFPLVPGPVPAGLPSELLGRRPDLVAAFRRLEGADWRLAQARASLLPRISLTASGGTSAEELSDLLMSQFKVWTLAGNLAAPIFEGGRLRGGVDRADARVAQALASYQSTVLRAFSEVESALVSEDRLARREERLGEAVEQSSAALRLAELRYQVGLDTFITVLEAQRRLFETETQLVTVRRQRLENRVDLHLALGGSFPISNREEDRQAASATKAVGSGVDS